ncbi:hypothetical protein [Pedobacter sp.]|uniref:hypothetical protein n=1 Tax=Pedobacter sp. TaxID=1411316 RepID=UPI00396C902E
MKKKYSFKDLQFKEHYLFKGVHAVMIFDNGYGVSVTRFKLPTGSYGSYTHNDNQYEVAIIFGTVDNYRLVFDTAITDSVIGYLYHEQVSEIMYKVQNIGVCYEIINNSLPSANIMDGITGTR